MITHYTGPLYNAHGRSYADAIAAIASNPHSPSPSALRFEQFTLYRRNGLSTMWNNRSKRSVV